MASIKKRRNKFNVVYYYITETGERKQKWEPYDTEAEAKKRKAEVEYKQKVNRFIAPSKLTVSEFLDNFVELYGEKKWGPHTYESNTALIRNYINPLIGGELVQSIDCLAADRLITRLQKTKSVTVNNRAPKTEFLSPNNIERINKLLKSAFKQAVRWGIVERNPFEDTTLPKVKKVPRAIWDVKTISDALDACRDPKLYVAMNLAFACSMRMGEILGLTWENTHISDENIVRNDAYIVIDKELARVKEETIETLGKEEIIKIFPRTMYLEGQKTRIVLKTPKTETSVRKVWIPETLAYILREWREAQEKQKGFLGSEYQDHDLVVALANGRPCETKVIENAFNRLKRDAKLPNVVFHSLRHSSATYKLKLNHGDLKATQGDTGHAQAQMLTEIYAHILDEDRKVNAQKFEVAFYSNPDLRGVRAPEPPAPTAFDLAALVDQLQKSPELREMLASVLSGQNVGKADSEI